MVCKQRKHLNNISHFLLIDTSVTVDVVQTKCKFQLVCWLSALRYVDRLLTTIVVIIII